MKITLQLHTLKGDQGRWIAVLIAILFSLPLFSQTIPRGTMKITFTDIRSDIGILAVGVYSGEEQWIYEPEYSYHFTKEAMREKRLTVEIPDLPYGRYAISVLDDENKNDEMEYIMGIPREGWGMSTNPSFLKLKAPAFAACSIELDVPKVSFEIKLNYVRKNKEITEQ